MGQSSTWLEHVPKAAVQKEWYRGGADWFYHFALHQRKVSPVGAECRGGRTCPKLEGWNWCWRRTFWTYNFQMSKCAASQKRSVAPSSSNIPRSGLWGWIWRVYFARHDGGARRELITGTDIDQFLRQNVCRDALGWLGWQGQTAREAPWPIWRWFAVSSLCLITGDWRWPQDFFFSGHIWSFDWSFHEVHSNTSDEILLCDDFRGCMYVLEMRVHENRAAVVSNRQGLNITSQIPGQSRDRIGFLGKAAKSAQTFSICECPCWKQSGGCRIALWCFKWPPLFRGPRFFPVCNPDQSGPSQRRSAFGWCMCSSLPTCFSHPWDWLQGAQNSDSETQEEAVNISEKLFAGLRRAPNFRTPEEYWKMQQGELAKSAERIPWTDKYDCAVRIVQAALRTQVSYEVAYDSDPGDDLSITVSGTSPEQKLVVSEVSADGPASRACIGVRSELVGRDFSDGTESIACHRLKSTLIFQRHERTLSVLARDGRLEMPFQASVFAASGRAQWTTI